MLNDQKWLIIYKQYILVLYSIEVCYLLLHTTELNWISSYPQKSLITDSKLFTLSKCHWFYHSRHDSRHCVNGYISSQWKCQNWVTTELKLLTVNCNKTWQIWFQAQDKIPHQICGNLSSWGFWPNGGIFLEDSPTNQTHWWTLMNDGPKTWNHAKVCPYE